MIIAQKLRETNRAEYLLYMWQVEDLIRAFEFDAERIESEYISRFEMDDTTRAETVQWYANLCQMMREEGLRENGHLQINKNTLSGLEEMHKNLLQSEKFPYYRQMYYKILPHIVELRSKNKESFGEKSELETCFDALYGVMMLRLKGQEVSQATITALQDISRLTGQLADYFKKSTEEAFDF